MYRLLTILLLLSLLILAGCSSDMRRDIDYAPPRPAVTQQTPQTDGSIYMSGRQLSWFEDMRARRVGDILTVVLNESTNATKSAKTSTAKNNSNSITSPNILGSVVQFAAPKFLPLASHTDNDLSIGLGSEHTFEGAGSAAQSNALTGNITVSVIEVLPNRNLHIRGEKRLGINNGMEYIKLSGIIRPQDISPYNTIESSRVADVTIIYNGDGQIAETGKRGWFSRLFSSELFPF